LFQHPFEEDVIRLLAYDAVSKAFRIKVFPDGKEPICHSYFIDDSRIDWASEETDSLFIAPFKDVVDNRRLVKCDQIMLAYEYGRYNLEARRLKFLGQEKVNGQPAFRFSLPKIYQVASRRKMIRHRIPADMPCGIIARKKTRGGDQKLRGMLFDVHGEGFCFAGPTDGVTFEKGDQIKLSLETRQKHFGVIHCIVKILSKVQYRRSEGSGRPYIYYGTLLLNISDGHLLSLYISEIKEKETEVRKATQVSELTQKLFGKIKQRSGIDEESESDSDESAEGSDAGKG
jgi:hypothetical protein